MFDILIHLMASLATDGVRVIPQNVIPLIGIVREKTPFTTCIKIVSSDRWPYSLFSDP